MFLPGQTIPWSVFDPVAVSLINNICQRTDAKIVLHSSWVRILGGENTFNHCISQGINPEYFHDTDLYCKDLNSRYSRIEDWLTHHHEVEKFCIIDDEPPEEGDEFEFKFTPHLVLVNYYIGLLFKEYNDILSKLK
jgi:hypothetical protein